jgi:hypothetical protein
LGTNILDVALPTHEYQTSHLHANQHWGQLAHIFNDCPKKCGQHTTCDIFFINAHLEELGNEDVGILRFFLDV